MLELFLVLLLGLVSGMCVNYLADVLPSRRRFTKPFCLKCSSQMGIWNYFIWPRKCNICQQRRALRTWFVEGLFIVLFLFLQFYPPPSVDFIGAAILFVYFGVVCVIDIEHRVILHPVSIFGIIIGAIIGYRLHGWIDTLVGGLAGFGMMLVFYFLGIWFVRISRKMRGKEIGENEGLGFGDVNLGGVIGLLLGWPGIIAGLVLTLLMAGIASLIYLLIAVFAKKYQPNLSLPFGPFIAASALILLIF